MGRGSCALQVSVSLAFGKYAYGIEKKEAAPASSKPAHSALQASNIQHRSRSWASSPPVADPRTHYTRTVSLEEGRAGAISARHERIQCARDGDVAAGAAGTAAAAAGVMRRLRCILR